MSTTIMICGRCGREAMPEEMVFESAVSLGLQYLEAGDGFMAIRCSDHGTVDERRAACRRAVRRHLRVLARRHEARDQERIARATAAFSESDRRLTARAAESVRRLSVELSG